MKSFAKTFRAILAMSLALCMVMSFVTVSADSVTLEKVTVGDPVFDSTTGYYSVQYKVSGISADGGNATILVYETNDAGEISNSTIEYANQMPVTSGEATFTMLVENGNYTVLAGGTGFATAATATVTAGTAPTITAAAVSGVKDNQENAVVANITVNDADATETDDNIASVAITAGNDDGYFAIGENNTIVTAKAVPANTYNLTLTVTDDEGLTGTCTVAITIDTSVITVALDKDTVGLSYKYGEDVPKAPVATDYIIISDAEATLSAWSEGVTEGNVTTYTATLTLPDSYQFEDGEKTAEVTYTVTYNETRTTITSITLNKDVVEIGYNGTPDFSDIKATTDAGEELAFESETWAGSIDATQDGATAEYTNKVVVPEDKYIYNGSIEVKVTVTVKDGRTVIKEVTYKADAIKVDYNTSVNVNTLLPAITFVGAEDVVADVTWDNGGYDAQKPGTYTFIATINNVDTNDYKFEIPAETVISVDVTVGRNQVIVRDGQDIEINGDYSLDDGLTVLGGDAAVWVQGTGKATITGGTYEAGQTPYVEDAPEGAIYDQTAVLAMQNAQVIIKNGIFTGKGLATADAGHIDLIYAMDNASITIEGGTFIAADNTVWLVNVKDDSNATITISGGTFVGWNPATQANDAGVTIADGFTVEETTYEGAVAYKVIPRDYVVSGYEFYDEKGNVVEEVYVEDTTGFDEAVMAYFPVSVKLTTSTEEMVIENLKEIEGAWTELEKFPPEAWDSAMVSLTNAVLPEGWSFGTIVPEIKVTTKGDAAFDVTVDGYAKTSVASLKTQDAEVEVVGLDGKPIAGIAEKEAYGFVVDGNEEVWQNDPVITVKKDDAISKHTVTARIKLADGTISEPQTVYIYKYTTLFNGGVYINDTANPEKAYSAVRSNRNRDITVTHDFTYANDAAYDFTKGTATVKVYKAGNETEEGLLRKYTFESGAKSVVIPAADVKTFATTDGEYKFIVEYVADDAKVGAKTNRRGTYISNNGTWYSSFLINGLSRSGIVMRKTDNLVNDIDFTDLGADDKIYVGHFLNKFSDNSNVASANFAEVTDKDYKYTLDLTPIFENEATNTAYKFYSQVKLDSANSEITDMNIGRVVYIYDRLSTVTNLAVNNSCASGPVIADGKLVFKPYWYKEARKDEFNYETITYTLTFTEGIKDGADFVNAVEAADGVIVSAEDKTITFTEVKGAAATSTVTIDASIFASRVKATLVVEIDDVVDNTVNRVFWPQAQ